MMKIKELREITGLSQQQFADKFKIPVGSLRNWEQEKRSPPEYLPGMIEEILRLEAQPISGQQTINYTPMTDEEIINEDAAAAEPKIDKELIKKLIQECDIEPKTSSFCRYKPEKGGCGKCTKPDYEDCNIKAWKGYEELERMIENENNI